MTNELNIEREATPPTTDWLAGTEASRTGFGDVSPDPISATSEVAEAPTASEVTIPKFDDHIDAMADPIRPTPEATDIAIGPAVFYPGEKPESGLNDAPEVVETPAEPTIEPPVENPTEVALAEETSAEISKPAVSEPETETSFPEEASEINSSEDKVQETLTEVDNWLSQADQLRGDIRESLATLAEQKAAETERHEQAVAAEEDRHNQKMTEFKSLENKFRDAERRVEERFEKTT